MIHEELSRKRKCRYAMPAANVLVPCHTDGPVAIQTREAARDRHHKRQIAGIACAGSYDTATTTGTSSTTRLLNLR